MTAIPIEAVHVVLDRAADRRARRVGVLLVGIVILSLADLILTLTNLWTVGMVEANPIAHLIIDTTRSAISLSCYKLLTVVICVALLHRVRHSVQGELAAWACLIILSGLVVWWIYYTRSATVDLVLAVQQSEVYGREWLTLAPSGPN